jgi:hypothetical protein
MDQGLTQAPSRSALPGYLVACRTALPTSQARPVRVIGLILPSGLEKVFVQAAYFRGLQGPPDPERIREIGSRYGLTTVGAPIAVPEVR